LSYFKVKEDLKLILDLNVKYYRFSISWSRIFPSGKSRKINNLGAQYYSGLIDVLLEAGVTPVVTLYHWDLPQALEDEYLGWLNSNIQIDFMKYAETCFTLFGDRVKWWITINEPWTFAVNGYVSGINAPGRCSDRLKCVEGNSSTEAYQVAHNVLGAHSRVVELYRFPYLGPFLISLAHL
jgi:beta-glucosidase